MTQPSGRNQTEESNKAVVRRFVEDAWNGGNLTLIDELFTPDYKVNGELQGVDGVKRAVEALQATFGDAAVTLEEMVAEGDKVVARWTLRGVHWGEFLNVPPTGKVVTLRGINIYRLDAGRLADNHEVVDVYGLLQQLRS